MFLDIAPLKFYNQFAIKTPKAGDLIFIFKDGNPLLYRQNTQDNLDTQLIIPTYEIIAKFFPKAVKTAVYLCAADETCGFLIDSEAIEAESQKNLEELQDFALETLRFFRGISPVWHGFMAVTASHLNQWYRYNKFCGGCGTKMIPSEKERAMVCPCCSFTDYPKICPAVIVAIKHGDHILLTKYANRAFTRYALIAGFCEIGETVEQTIHREVLEEVGVRVKNLTYYKSQPWGFSESLLMGFFAELDGADDITLDQNELEVGEWVHRSHIPDDTENSLSLTYTMMQAFKSGEIQ